MKIAKLSLVAAVAVAGLSTANAQPLEQAIKDVDVSGTVVYRYNDRANDKEAGTGDGAQNYYKIGVSLKSKVTEDVTFNTRIVADEDPIVGNNNGLAKLDTSTVGDKDLATEITNANFAYSGIANSTIIVGKQGIALPWTVAVDSDGREDVGTGILGITTVGPVTLLGGYFNQSNLLLGKDSTQLTTDTNLDGLDLATVGAIAKFGPVDLKAVYLDIKDTADTYFVKANGNVGPVTAFAQYSELDLDGVTTNNDNSLLKVGVSAKLDIFDAGFAYAETGKDGSGIVNSLSENGAIGYNVSLHNADNANAIFVDLGAQVLPKLHLGLNYDKVSDDDANKADDHEETYLQATYAHSKNLSAYVRLATGEDATVDYDAGRLQVEYKF